VAREFTVAPVDDGRRLDRFLQKLEGGLPASLVRRLLRQRRVRVNGRRVRDGNLRLMSGDQIELHAELRVDTPESDHRTWTLDPLPALHHDEEFLVVNKPAGVACSDDGEDPAAIQVWLREFLAAQIREGQVRPEPCHRLDRGTTGLVVVALTPASFDRFRRALQSGQVHKTYEVVVHGVPEEPEFECRQPLERVPHARPHEPRMVAGAELSAHTDFRLLRSAGGLTLLQARLHSGRTHQIRAHCRILGLPVVGDPRYGEPRDMGHQLLHAREIALDGGQGWRVTAGWPEPEAAWLRSHGLAT
jgi:23S rRNA pseudouridine955/2504/2580 synthase